MEKKNALKMPPSPATMAALGTPHPSRAPTVSARDVEVQGIANMALHPTPNNQQETLFPIDAARFPIDERRID